MPKSTTIGFVGDPGTEAELQRGASTLSTSQSGNHVRLQSLSSLTWEEASSSLDALLVIPEVSTWCRSRHRRHTGPQPVRDMNNHWGFPWLQDKDQETVNSANKLLRQQFTLMADWVKQKPSCPMLLIHPEDLGVADSGYPASIWQLPELRLWANEWGLKRYGTFQCHFGPGAWPFPVGLLSTHPLPHKLFHPGWPKFQTNSRKYVGPIPRYCRCPQGQHRSDNDFHHRHLRTRSSSLLLDGFADYLMTSWAPQSTGEHHSAKLWQQGSAASTSLVRADEDSDATDAEQAEVHGEILDSMDLDTDQDAGRPALDVRALEALGIGGRTNRYGAEHGNFDDHDYDGDVTGSKGLRYAQGSEESKGSVISYPIQDRPEAKDFDQEKQVKQKKTSMNTEGGARK